MTSVTGEPSIVETDAKFIFLTERLLSLTHYNGGDKKLISSYLNDLNDLDYRNLTIGNTDEVTWLMSQLCSTIPSTETLLVKNLCHLLINLLRNNVTLNNNVYEVYKTWLIEVLESSQPLAWNDVLPALQSFLATVQIDDINQYLQRLFKHKNVLTRHLDNCEASDMCLQAVGCLEAILLNKKNSTNIECNFIVKLKDIILNVVSSLPCSSNDVQYQNKILSSCLHILYVIIADKLVPISADFIGETLGVVQAFLFHGLKGYMPIKPQLLRPAAMNLPDPVHVVPKCKNLKNHKAKLRKHNSKKASEMKSGSSSENKGVCKYSSDSDTSDTEINSGIQMDFKVRLEAAKLLQVLVENTQSRDIFGYWPQIVSTGTRNDARVLTRSIIKETVSKVRQRVLITLTELLIGAKPFLIHAEDVEHTSFITFFGTVCLMVKELHLTLSFAISVEKNAAVLTHALKCAAALIQGTPYSRLKPGLATTLTRNFRPLIFHKDPTVKVAALSAFEGLASCEPITQEIFNILGQQYTLNGELEKLNLNTSSVSDTGTEEEEIDVQDMSSSISRNSNVNETLSEKEISFLVRICLENVLAKGISVPVRLQSLKLLGRLAFNTGNLIFPHLETIITSLVSATQESETQIVLHICRVLEIMGGCLTNNDTDDKNISMFWNIILEPVISFAQHTQVVLKEAACDCLGSISATMLAQLSRQKTVLIITVLFGATRDEESAVRAAGLRALGMLVTLPTLQEDTGFLLDSADIIYSVFNDRSLGVRIKAAWTLANLCDCLSGRKYHEEIEPVPLDILLPKLYYVSVNAAKDSDKVKCNAVRAIGTILYMCPDRQVIKDTSLGLDALINCATIGNDMKVRWNACRALGLVMSRRPDEILPPSWKDQVFPTLCTLICHSPNFKVRTNAAWALYSCNSFGKYIATLWKSVVLAFENSQHVPSYMEYSHRDALMQQLCQTLSHIATHTKESDLQAVWNEIGDHLTDVSNYIGQLQETIVPEKLGDLMEAKGHLEKYMKIAVSSEDRCIAETLANIFERTNKYDTLGTINSL